MTKEYNTSGHVIYVGHDGGLSHWQETISGEWKLVGHGSAQWVPSYIRRLPERLRALFD